MSVDPPPAAPATGLRERKKRERRQAIAAAALDLFAAQGFHGTTISQIAAAADVAPRTVFVHFPSKEDLLFPDAAVGLASLTRRLDGRPAGESTTEALQAWVVEATHEHWTERERLRRAVIAREPDLRLHERRILDGAEEVLARSLARDLRLDAHDPAVRIATAGAIGALTAITELGHERPDLTHDEHRREVTAIFDDALAFVDGGVRALGRRVERRNGEHSPTGAARRAR